MIIDLAELLRVHPQFSRHLGVSMRQVMAFARIYPGLRYWIELGCFFSHWDLLSILAHRLRDSLENRQRPE
jgi:hypothetical protein